ncbi:EAL domain-containing protein (putative c-di-GMP-specific phosphodiesterase class I) [Loktanella ponticola]|uniref:EAL domain-containing protein (Putative c-di-GMP-specific phosphodiesterase class I) n=1 Tax=Yoonia ponticola TaxID=1524255 RepID=A0A7W9EXN5_9RHOB|nr:EAL domain-containing protein [Yoonia ponticola]MBB5721897.1 EAL domain-containing protein (putative c-di-GMP-specific phosphodiesterase class I) [Yoonia ponticola]
MLFFDDEKVREAPIDVIEDALEAVRVHMRMDVAYISEVSGDSVIFRHIAGTDSCPLLEVGRALPDTHTFCGSIANTDIPFVVPDTHVDPAIKDLPFIHDAKVRAFVAVPISHFNGEHFGMFCCYSHEPRPDISQRDLATVLMFAKLTVRTLKQHFDTQAEIEMLRSQLAAVIKEDALSIHLQPIVSLSDRRPMAAEALSRFSVHPSLGPQWWFEQAQRSDMQIELEVAAVSKALRHLNQMPERTYLSVNASPLTVSSPQFMEAMRGVPTDRVLVELTEREIILETTPLMQALAVLREKRIGIAIDDVGAGYAGLSTIVSLKPNVLKLDRSLVSQIQSCTVKQSLTKAMVHFATEMDAFLVAEGVETVQEHDALRRMGVRLGQGFYYARPTEAEKATKAMRDFYADRPTLRSVS